jgi:WD40 repeat protein/serine/threonine protein kinase/tetratricopeptide (TPR) repeat protein
MTTPGGDRNPVEVLAEEFLERKRRGEPVTPDDYAARHPELAGEILALFPALLMMEDLGGDSGDRTGSIATGAGAVGGARSGRLGEFVLLREVGRGGMGVVYEAEQESLGRRVALKVLPAGALSDRKQVRRFEREARAAARLHHTNIVPVFGVGQHEGTHFYVMQFIHGQGLDAVLRELKRLRDARSARPGQGAAAGRTGRQHSAAIIAQSLATGRFAASGPSPGQGDGDGDRSAGTATAPWAAPASRLDLTPIELGGAEPSSGSGSSGISSMPETDRRYALGVARIGVQVAEALAYAHAQGILHRDIKPSNLLLDRNGNVWVADFGLAKGTGADDLTHTGDIVGTVRYMAPERFRGEGDARADVYALGLTLYELLALRPAYDESDRASLIRQVTQEDAPRLRKRNRAVPTDLETIVHKAMAREPTQRYPSAAALAEDLNRFVEGRPILARRVSAGERLWRWCRRNPWLAAAIGSAAAALVAVALISVVYAAEQAAAKRKISGLASNLQRALDRSNRLAGDLRSSLKESDRRLTVLYFERGHAACTRGDIGPGLLWLVQSWRSAVAAGDPAWQRTAQASVAAWGRHHGGLKAVLSDPELRQVNCVAFSPDGKMAITGFGDYTGPGHAQLWDVATGAAIGPPLSQPELVNALAFSPDGKTVLTASYHQAQLWDVATGRPIGATVNVREGRYRGTIRTVAFSPDGKSILTGGDSFATRLWDAATGEALGPPLLGNSGTVMIVAFSPDGKTFLTFSGGRHVNLWDAASGRLLGSLLPSTGRISAVAFSPDGKAILTGGDPSLTRLWDAATRQPIGAPLGLKGGVYAVAFSPDGKTILTGGEPPMTQLWDAATRAPIGPALTPEGSVWAVAFSPDGRTVATGGYDGRARLWDVATGATLGVALAHQGAISAVAFSPDGKCVLTASRDKTARLWDADPGQPIGEPVTLRTGGGFSDLGQVVAFSPDGKFIVATIGFRTVRVWDVATGRPLGPPLQHESQVASLALSPDGKTVITGHYDQKARVWDAATGRAQGEPLTPQGPGASGGPVSRVAFSPDGKTLLTGSYGGTVQLWDIASRRPHGPPLAHPGASRGVAFGPDGKIAITGGVDSTAQLWDLSTGRALGPPLEHAGRVSAVAFSPDGRSAITGGVDSMARLWDVATGKPLTAPLAHQGSVSAVAFSPDGKFVLTGSSDKTARLWDATTAQPVGPPLLHPGGVSAVQFSLDGRSVLTAVGSRSVRRWDLPWLPEDGDLEHVATWAEVTTGLELDAQSQVRILESAAWRQRRDQGSRLGRLAATKDQGKRLDPILYGPEPAARARAWIERQRWAEAEAAFDEAVGAWPYDAALVAERGRFLADHSQPIKADADFARAYALGARAADLLKAIIARESLFQRMITDAPETAAPLLVEHGEERARQGRWASAAADFSAASRIEPPTFSDFTRLVVSFRAAGDAAGLRRTRADLLARFGTTGSGLTPRGVAWLVVLAPGTDIPSDVPVRLAELALSSVYSEYQPALYLNTLGAALYRAGRFEEAARRLEEAIQKRRGVSEPNDWAFLALAHHRLGHDAEARAWLDRFRADPPRESPDQFWPAQQNRLLRNEAEAAILWDPIFPDDPFVP